MYTHIIKKSGKRCFGAAWWPSVDPSLGHKERAYPLMFIEGGQITRINTNNLRKTKR